MSKQQFHQGDDVEWDSHGGTAYGKVERDGGTAVHKPSALRRRRSK